MTDAIDLLSAADPYLHLEDVTGALDHVRERNAETTGRLVDDETRALEARLRDVLDADTRIPYPRRRGGHLYNFWTDAEHVRGLWRRCSPASYLSGAPEWEVLIDVDALAAAEGENWVWKGASVLRPTAADAGRDRALVLLSRGGADAVEIREFDVPTRAFVAAADGGFTLPEAKSDVAWVDRDTLLVGTDLGPGSTTESGYPVQVRVWRRGTDVAAAPVLYAGKAGDVAVGAGHDPTPGHEYTLVQRATDFFHTENLLLPGGVDALLAAAPTPTRLDVPADATVGIHRGRLTLLLREDWTPAGTTYAAGSLLGIAVDAFLAGDRAFTPLVVPDAHTSVQAASWTRDVLVVTILRDVVSHVVLLTPPAADSPAGTPWATCAVTGFPEAATIEVVGTDEESAEYWAVSSGFTTPPTLWRGDAATPDAAPTPVWRTPELFDSTGLRVTRHFAVSDDGTRVPYFLVRRAGATGPGPTLLGGYGGFEVSRLPGYAPVLGAAWLERGGTYALANIRGGGEYGPAWHRAALKEKRPRAFEDFAAVARALVATDVCTPATLAARGGSNGGLLMGVMLTRHPELFGGIVCQVPLLDMLRYHLLPAGASWIAEYGDPRVPDEREALAAYSPYHHVVARDERPYPPVLITTSTRDDRVHPGHARKMAARLRAAGQPCDYFENIEGGHGGAADNRQVAFVESLIHTWLRRHLVDPRPATGSPPCRDRQSRVR